MTTTDEALPTAAEQRARAVLSAATAYVKASQAATRGDDPGVSRRKVNDCYLALVRAVDALGGASS